MYIFFCIIFNIPLKEVGISFKVRINNVLSYPYWFSINALRQSNLNHDNDSLTISTSWSINFFIYSSKLCNSCTKYNEILMSLVKQWDGCANYVPLYRKKYLAITAPLNLFTNNVNRVEVGHWMKLQDHNNKIEWQSFVNIFSNH